MADGEGSALSTSSYWRRSDGPCSLSLTAQGTIGCLRVYPFARLSSWRESISLVEHLGVGIRAGQHLPPSWHSNSIQ